MNVYRVNVLKRFLPFGASLVALILASPLLSAGMLSVTPMPGAQSLLEGIPTAVTFRATNTTGMDLVLDYAFTVINGPPGDAIDTDNVFFNSVTFPTVILNNGFGDFTYGLDNPNNPTDPQDNGLNNISFILGMAPWNHNGVPAINQAKGLGFFIFKANGVGSNGPIDPVTLGILNGCFANPGPVANPCPTLGANNFLYPNEVRSQPFPAVATVTVNDIPEPATMALFLLGGACALLFPRRLRADHSAEGC